MTTAYDAPIPYNSDLSYNGGQSVVTSDELPTWILRATSKAGVTSYLPEAIVDQASFESSAPSAVSFKIAKGTVGYDVVDDYTIVDLLANGQPVDDGRWLLRGKGWAAGSPDGTKSYTGKSLLWDRLEHTVIQPGKRYLYQAKTVGYILNDVFADAQARDAGYWDTFTWTFDSTKDSNGAAWPNVLGSLEYLPNAKYSDIVANLVDRGLIKISLRGNEIRIEVAGSEGRITPALLVLGEDLTDAPQQSMAEIITDVVILGDDGVAVTRSNPTARAAYWREEAGISQGGTKDVGVLSIFGDVTLSGGDAPRVQRAYGLVITQERKFLPLRDYIVEDWVKVQHSDEFTDSFRVKQIVLKQDPKVGWSGSLVLNDKFLENELRLTKRVDGILGGATIVGNSQTAPTPEDLRDTGVPNAPTGLIIGSIAYQDNQGITRAVATFNWAEVTTNTDGSTVNDLQDYILAWRYLDGPEQSWSYVWPTENTVSVSGLEPARTIVAFVRARDVNGNTSASSDAATLTLAEDDIAPTQPSMPTATCSLKVFRIDWDGLDFNGDVMPPDLNRIDVYISQVWDFDPFSDGAIVGSMISAGSVYVVAAGYELGEEVYFKFVAVDNSGNRSDPSDQDFTWVQGIDGPDMEFGSITTNLIAAGAIKAQHIEVGAITADKISLGATMNLVQDPSFNSVDWRTKRLTTDWAERPNKWFFNNWSGISRNGYYLQALSTVASENGGRMYITDWIACQPGETYWASTMMRNGEFAPSAGSTVYLGLEATLQDGSVAVSGQSFTPTGSWVRNGYSTTISDTKWTKVRFFVRADNLFAGDIAMDDWEVRSGVGTTASAGSRILATPEGFFAWNSSDVKTFEISAVTGNAFFLGQIVSGIGGKRLEINPGATYLPEIRFYADNSNLPAYINAVGSPTTPFIGMNAPDSDPTGSFKVVLTDTNMLIGQYTTALVNTGTAIYSEQGDGYMYMVGKMPGAVLNNRSLFQGGKFIVGAGTTGLTVSKSTVLGLQFVLYSLARGTTTLFQHHLSQDATTAWTVTYGSHATIGTGVQFLNFRGDVL